MFQRLFGNERAANRRIVDRLYEHIVAAARREAFYSSWQVPDTPLGRFEMLSLHMFLLQHRLRGEDGLQELAQTLIDDFFTDVDHSLRELGIGDLGVPKRVRKLARMFYGRTASYSAALDAGDRGALVAALSRNVRPDAGTWPQAEALGDYVIGADEWLRGLPSAEIAAGTLGFPEPGSREAKGGVDA